MKNLLICLCFSIFGLATTYAQTETVTSSTEQKVEAKKACSGEASVDGEKKACCSSKAGAGTAEATSNKDKKACSGKDKDGKACCAGKKGKTASIEETKSQPVMMKAEQPVMSRTKATSEN